MKGRTKNRRGGALAETAAGLFILLPVFLLLVDVISLVIAQSINDDLAKQSARAASLTGMSYLPGTTTPDPKTMQNNANAAVQQYLSETQYINNTQGLVCDVNWTCTFNATTGQVQVITTIRCNLPIPVPFGGPSYTVFQAQAVEPITGIQPSS